MRSTAAARRYARALFGLATDENRVGEVSGEIGTLSELLQESKELSEALLTPLHPAKERKAVLDAVAEQAQLSPTVRHFYMYLIDQRRLVDFVAVQDEYERLAAEASGRMTAQVVSASPLDDSRRAALARALSQRTGRTIELEVSVDPELIGGAIAKVGDMVFDGSLRTQLEQLHANLTKGS